MRDQLFNGSQPFGVTKLPVNIKSSKNGNQTDINNKVDTIYTTKS